MTPAALHQRPAAMWAAATALFLFSGLLLYGQGMAVTAARTQELPIAADIPALEQRLRVLRQETDTGHMQAQLRLGSPEEKMHLYALPEGGGATRAVQLFDVLREALTKNGTLQSLSDVQVGNVTPSKSDPRITLQAVKMNLVVNDDGLKTLLRLVPLTGLVTVADALTDEQREELTLAAERQNPASVGALAQFFATDFLDYIRSPRATEQRLLASIPAEEFSTLLHRTVAASPLDDAQQLFQSDVGNALVRANLWPLPFLTVDDVIVQEGDQPEWQRVTLIVQAYGRAAKK